MLSLKYVRVRHVLVTTLPCFIYIFFSGTNLKLLSFSPLKANDICAENITKQKFLFKMLIPRYFRTLEGILLAIIFCIYLLFIQFTRVVYEFLIWSNKLGEWLLFNTNSAIFQIYHDENKLIFNEMMMMRSTLQ